MKFGEKLKELREAASMTQDSLANESGVPVTTLRGYEQCKRIPVFGAIIRLSKALGTDCRAFADCEDVTGGDDDPPAKTKGGKGKKGG